MNRLARNLVSIFVLLVSAVLATAAARAGEEPPVVRALLDSSAINAAGRPTYGGLDVAGDGTITLSDLTTTFEADSDPEMAMSYDVKTLVLAGVNDMGGGLFEVASAEWRHVIVTSGGESVAAVPLITAKSLYIHQPGAELTAIERLRSSNVLAREFAMPEALVLLDNHSIVLEGLSGTWDGDPMTGAGISRFSARRIHVPGELFEDRYDDNPLAMAGYSELELAVEGTSTTVYSDDAVGFDLEMRLDGRDVGRLIVEFGADGIPLALFSAVDTAEPDPAALAGFADGVSLKRARIRFEDGSLTGRLLSLMAEMEDTDVETLVADGTAELDAVLAEVLEPDLARQVSAALTAYLNDPRSLTFALSPAQPVHFAQVMSGLEDPMTLIELLKPSITAND
jgi:hypothetical protein